MLQSQLFTKTRKEAPKDEVAKNAQLLIRAGYIHKEMAGVYDYLPLGLRVIQKIKNIINEEMQAIGSQEVSLSTLQDPEIWKLTNRWDDEKVDVWFKTKLKNDTELTKRGIKEGFWKYASFPVIFQYKLLIKEGVDIYKQEHGERLSRLLENPDYSHLKTTTKVHKFK